MVPDALSGVSAVAIASLVLTIGVRLGLQQSDAAGDLATSGSQTHQAIAPNPADFSAEELEHLQRRFGVHGPQTPLAQLFTRGVDQLEPLRANTLSRLRTLKPMIWREARHHQINPMLITAILFDEIQHSKPGEDLPFVVHSGLVDTHGPAQLGISELVHRGRLSNNPSSRRILANLLMDPAANVELLAAKLSRLRRLGLDRSSILIVAVLTWMRGDCHPGLSPQRQEARLSAKSRYMQDPALHGLIYSSVRPALAPLI